MLENNIVLDKRGHIFEGTMHILQSEETTAISKNTILEHLQSLNTLSSKILQLFHSVTMSED